MQFLLDELMIRVPLRSFALLTSRMQIIKFRNICAIQNFTLRYCARALENKNFLRVLIRIFQRCILKLGEFSRKSLDSRLDRLQNRTVRFEGRSLGQYLILRD